MEAARNSDWAQEVEEFEKTKAGVKGLVDSGVSKIPRIFVHPPETLHSASSCICTDEVDCEIPIIDLQGAESTDGARRRKIVEEIRQASETWGFFQMVNHGVPLGVMDAILESTRRFHEQPKEAKANLYSTDGRKNVRFYSINGSFLESHVAGWKDILACSFHDDILDPQTIPSVCRKEVIEYVNYMIKLRGTMSELLSEALGLSSDYLARLECMKSDYLTCLYYPACPEADLTLGTSRHSDPTFLTVLVQDQTGGLQVLHDDHWVDVHPIPGALIANIGDLMQLITNDKFKSAEHRVLARSVGVRVSAACFFFSSVGHLQKPFGPIPELLSEKNPPVYREVTPLEYTTFYQRKVRDRQSSLSHFKL